MLNIKCHRCGSKNIGRRKDKRGLYEFYCINCGAQIKKASMDELARSYEEELEQPHSDTPVEAPPPKAEEDKPLCKWCTEDWGVRRGLSWMFIDDTKYCPMCGRKRKPDDRKY